MATTKALSVKHICDIIESCKQNQVSKLKFAGLELEFGSQPDGTQPAYAPQLTRREMRANQAAVKNPPEVSLTPEQEEILDQARKSEILAMDPEAYEQERVDELFDDGSSLPEGHDGRDGRADTRAAE